MSDRIWFTTAQAGEHTGHHKDTIRRACEAKELHGGQRVAGKSNWRIHIACLDAWAGGVPCPHAAQLTDTG